MTRTGGTLQKKCQKSERAYDMETKPFRLPCLMKLEDLMQKFSGRLEINWRSRHQDTTTDGKLTSNSVGVSRCNPNKSNGIEKHPDLKNITLRRDSRGSSSSNGSNRSGKGADDRDLSEEIKARAGRRVGFKRTPKHKTSPVKVQLVTSIIDDNATEKINTSLQAARGRRANKVKEVATAATAPKPASKPVVKSSRKGPEAAEAGKTRSGKVRHQQESGKVNAQYVFGGYRFKTVNPSIDTKNYVDESIISFLPEMCQRVGVELVKDPMQLCTKFKLIADHFDLNEIECVDMTND